MAAKFYKKEAKIAGALKTQLFQCQNG